MIFWLVAGGAQAQVPARLLEQVRTLKGAQKLIADHPNLPLYIVRFSSERDTAAAMASFFDKKPGDIFTQDSFQYKVLTRETFGGLRCSYVFLDGDSLSPSQIDRTRKEIIRAYRAGTPFTDLVHQYTMDGNPTGDTGWFGPDQMVRDFEDAVRDHKPGDLFTLDLPDKRWYYVVLKTHANTTIKKVSLLVAKTAGN